MKKAFFYYNQLPKENQKKLYIEILNCIKKSKNSVYLKNTVLSKDEIQQVLYAVDYDYPELFYVSLWGEGCEVVRYRNQDMELKFQFLFPIDKQQKIIQNNEKFIHYLLQHIPEADRHSQYRTALWLHDLLIRNVLYNHDAVTKGPKEEPDAYTVMGIMRRKKAVCSGISKVYQMLCEHMDIWCIYVSGDSLQNTEKSSSSVRHAWNMISIGGEYAHVDVTWDLQEEEELTLSHAYFGMSDEQCCRERTLRQLFPSIRLPVCSEKKTLNYFVQNRCFIRNFTEFGIYVREIVQKKKEEFSFQIDPQGQDHDRIITNMEAWMKKMLCDETNTIREWKWSYNQIMMEFIYKLKYYD